MNIIIKTNRLKLLSFQKIKMPLFNVIVIPMLQDNFSYYTYPSDNINKGFFVDVSQPEKLN